MKADQLFNKYSYVNISNWARLICAIKTLLIHIKKQKKFLNTSFLSQYKEPISKLSPGTQSKINNYYALGVPAILGGAIATLRGYEPTPQERSLATITGVCSAIFDDFFDKYNYSHKRIAATLQQPGLHSPMNASEKLGITLYQVLLKSEKAEQLRARITLIHQAQEKSRKQKDKTISTQELEEITREKGGHSFLLYREIFDPVPDNNESAYFMTLGEVMQLENDIFDIWKDSQEGIHTLATTENIDTLTARYNTLINNLIAQSSQLRYTNKNKRKHLDQILLVLARGHVCLRKLKCTERKHNNRIQVNECSRKELICDMQHPFSILLNCYYFLLIKKL